MQTTFTLIPSPTVHQSTTPTKNAGQNTEAAVEPRNGFGSILKSQISNGQTKELAKAPKLPQQATAAKKETGQSTDAADAPRHSDTSKANGTSESPETSDASATKSSVEKDVQDQKVAGSSDADNLISVMTAFAPSSINQSASQSGSQAVASTGESAIPVPSGKTGKNTPLLTVSPADNSSGKSDSLEALGNAAPSTQVAHVVSQDSVIRKDEPSETFAAKLISNIADPVDNSITAPIQAPTALTPPTTTTTANAIVAPVHSDRWPSEIGQKVVWMVKSEESSATLTLNPPDLGPIKVVVHVQNGQAHASFSSDQPEVRQALLDAMPRLRDSMQDAGISFGQADVNPGNAQGQQREFSQASGNWRNSSPASDANFEVNTTSQPINLTEAKGLVDTFA